MLAGTRYTVQAFDYLFRRIQSPGLLLQNSYYDKGNKARKQVGINTILPLQENRACLQIPFGNPKCFLDFPKATIGVDDILAIHLQLTCDNGVIPVILFFFGKLFIVKGWKASICEYFTGILIVDEILHIFGSPVGRDAVVPGLGGK